MITIAAVTGVISQPGGISLLHKPWPMPQYHKI